MGKLIFLPVSVGGGLLAGLVSKKLFARIWRLIDDQEPPQADDQQAELSKLVLALVLEGALSRLANGLVEHGSRQGLQRLTGDWPGKPSSRDESFDA